MVSLGVCFCFRQNAAVCNGRKRQSTSKSHNPTPDSNIRLQVIHFWIYSYRKPCWQLIRPKTTADCNTAHNSQFMLYECNVSENDLNDLVEAVVRTIDSTLFWPPAWRVRGDHCVAAVQLVQVEIHRHCVRILVFVIAARVLNTIFRWFLGLLSSSAFQRYCVRYKNRNNALCCRLNIFVNNHHWLLRWVCVLSLVKLNNTIVWTA